MDKITHEVRMPIGNRSLSNVSNVRRDKPQKNSQQIMISPKKAITIGFARYAMRSINKWLQQIYRLPVKRGGGSAAAPSPLL